MSDLQVAGGGRPRRVNLLARSPVAATGAWAADRGSGKLALVLRQAQDDPELRRRVEIVLSVRSRFILRVARDARRVDADKGSGIELASNAEQGSSMTMAVSSPPAQRGKYRGRYTVLAVDYDGTLATHGTVDDEASKALEELKKTGRKLVLVTGREVEDVLRIFKRSDLFDRIVGENGAVVYSPADRRLEVLGEPPPQVFVDALRQRGITPLSVGHVIVATWEPNQTIVLDVIRDLGLELQVIFNKGAVMVLPAGTNKATGLEWALTSLQHSPHNTVGVGDAENDHAFLSICEAAVAVANAVQTLKERADWVTSAPKGAGVIEVVGHLIASDLEDQLSARRHRIQLGTTLNGEPLTVPAHGSTLLIAGSSASGKSTIATAILEQLLHERYQCCLIDPEGDYASLESAIVLGDASRIVTVDELLDVLRQPAASVVAVLLGLAASDRPGFFNSVVGRVGAFFAETGRPHWLVVDEAHLALTEHVNATQSLPAALDSTMLITVHPEQLPPDVLCSRQRRDRRRLERPRSPATGGGGDESDRAGDEAGTSTRRGALVGATGDGGPRQVSAGDASRRTAAASAQVRDRNAWTRQEFLLSRTGRQLAAARAEPRHVSADGGRSGRRHLDLPPPARRLLRMDS